MHEDTIAQIHLPEPERKLEPRDALAVRFAERFAEDFRSVDQPFLAETREHFEEAEIAELGMMIGQYLALGRMLVISGNHKMMTEIYAPDV